MKEEYERLHALVDDAVLDAIAATAGFDPPIGRLNLLDDATLRAIFEAVGLPDDANVLDLGCGRGFLGRWMAGSNVRVRYSGIDFSANAVLAVRRHLPEAAVIVGDLRAPAGGPFDAVFAIESFWAVDDDLAARLRHLLARGAWFVGTIASIDESHEARLHATRAALERAGFLLRRVGVAPEHAKAVGRHCAATLIESGTCAPARERLAPEAVRTLQALREGTFRYDVVAGQRA